MKPGLKVVAFNGSPRRHGNTAYLIGVVLKELEREGIETEFVQVGGHPLNGCRACGQCAKRKDGHCANNTDIVNRCIDKMRAADGIILGSPTYFSDLTPETKALIDRSGYVSRANGNFLRRKAGAAIVAVRRCGGIHVFDSINHFFTINEMVIPGSSYWNVGIGREEGQVAGDEEGLRTMKTLGENMAWLLKRISPAG
jgi:multimeric flavodoxin WrbA